jgi:Cu+-exporting ATPase
LQAVAFLLNLSRNVGSETVLYKICRLIEEAQMNQAPIQEFADKVSSIFVPVVIGISLSTFIVWYILASFTELIPKSWMKGQSPATFAVMFALPTLVISCPCALGLATPTAVMVGTGVGATHGVLIKGGEKLEMVSRIEAVVFDKTGTLTKGKPIISDFIRLKTCSERSKMLSDEDLLWLLGSLENNSNHPLANAVVTYAEKHGKSEKLQFATPLNLCAITGKGISGEIHQRSVGLGNRCFATVKQIELSAEVERAMASLEHAGRTAVFACVDDEVLAVIGISDEIRDDSKATIHYLQQHCIDVWMVSGDNCRTSSAVALALGISMEYVISEALPETKLEKVKSLQHEGKVVAMVGDGINDSPALAQAHIGISLSSGTDIATETADIILVKGDISDVCVAIDVARSIFNRIKINFLCALLYNCLCIPIAAGLFYPLVQITLPPVVAAAAMALSSISVVVSSLSLRCYKAPIIKKSHPQHSTIIHV